MLEILEKSKDLFHNSFGLNPILISCNFIHYSLQVTKEKLLEDAIQGHVLGEATLMAIF